MVRDARGKKMSKSFGNVVDPLDWIDKYGADALRFTLARGANPGTDVPISEDWVQGSRNFATKLWNATRFAMLRGATVEGELPSELSTVDRWILSRLAAVQAEADALYDDYEFAKVCDLLFHFAWDEVFDWYVELVKAPLDAGGAQADATRRVLGEVRGDRAAPAAPGHAVPHRDPVDGADRARVGGRRAVADAPTRPRPTRRPRPRSRCCSRWSPRSAGSVPSRRSSRATGWPQCSSSTTRRPLLRCRATCPSSSRWPACSR